jgi:N-methylhydantoinase B
VTIDKVTLEVLNNRYIGIVSEMGRNIWRSAFTPFVKEAWDFGMGLVTTGGEMFAYSKEIGVSFMVAAPFETAVNAVTSLEPGDVIIHNDPYMGSGGLASHLPDIQLIKPLFHDGEIVCYIWTFIHSSDVGGIAPGSISPKATEIFQEGLRIPPLKLYRRGELNDDVMALFLANSRIPLPNRGDMNALCAAMTVAEERIHETIKQYSLDVVKESIDAVLAYGEALAREVISDIPDGVYRFHDYVELDIIDAPHARISVAATIDGDNLHLDFTGTDPQVQAALNLATFGRNHHFLTGGLAGFFLGINPHIPLNKGVWRPIDVSIPEGTILTPVEPAAVGVRFATGLRALDVILGALSLACDSGDAMSKVSGYIPTAGAGMSGVLAMSVFDEETGERRVNVVSSLDGGSGARPSKDAVDGVGLLSGFSRSIPAEVIETELPIVVRRFRLRDEAPAAGKWRGGCGRDMVVEALVPGSVLTARGWERSVFRPWGRRGGEPGSLSVITLDAGTDRERYLGKVDVLHLQKGDTIRLETAGGAGYGDPLDRDPDRVLVDVLDDFISVRVAREDYGVIVENGIVHGASTEQLRAQRTRAVREPVPDFDFGEERNAYERVFPTDVHDRLLEELQERVRPDLRHYYLKKAYELLKSAEDPSRIDATSVLPIRS